MRFKVKDSDVTAADANEADLGYDVGAYTIPPRNLYRSSGMPQARPAQGPARWLPQPFHAPKWDENNVAYVGDYWPDAGNHSAAAGRRRRRYEIVR